MADREEFVELNRESRVLHRGFASPAKTAKEFADFLERSQRGDFACFLICLKSNEKIVGAISLSQIFMGPFRSAYLGYHIGAEYANQRLMTEALPLILKYAFKDLKLHRVEANIQPGNKASIALVRRAGFVREGFSRRYLKIDGRWRDHERWAILAEDWKSQG